MVRSMRTIPMKANGSERRTPPASERRSATRAGGFWAYSLVPVRWSTGWHLSWKGLDGSPGPLVHVAINKLTDVVPATDDSHTPAVSFFPAGSPAVQDLL